jgi:hypothetical protein
VGGNRDVGDDASLLETLRTCRLDIVAERGLDGVEEEEEDEEEEERDVDEQEDDDEVFDLGSVAQQRRPGGLDTRASLSARNAM